MKRDLNKTIAAYDKLANGRYTLLAPELDGLVQISTKDGKLDIFDLINNCFKAGYVMGVRSERAAKKKKA